VMQLMHLKTHTKILHRAISEDEPYVDSMDPFAYKERLDREVQHLAFFRYERSRWEPYHVFNAAPPPLVSWETMMQLMSTTIL